MEGKCLTLWCLVYSVRSGNLQKDERGKSVFFSEEMFVRSVGNHSLCSLWSATKLCPWSLSHARSGCFFLIDSKDLNQKGCKSTFLLRIRIKCFRSSVLLFHHMCMHEELVRTFWPGLWHCRFPLKTKGVSAMGNVVHPTAWRDGWNVQICMGAVALPHNDGLQIRDERKSSLSTKPALFIKFGLWAPCMGGTFNVKVWPPQHHLESAKYRVFLRRFCTEKVILPPHDFFQDKGSQWFFPMGLHFLLLAFSTVYVWLGDAPDNHTVINCALICWRPLPWWNLWSEWKIGAARTINISQIRRGKGCLDLHFKQKSWKFWWHPMTPQFCCHLRSKRFQQKQAG